VFIDFLARLIKIHAGRKIYLGVDNHSTHHTKKVKLAGPRRTHRQARARVPARAYSPELNPDENLNQDLKRHLRATSERPTDRASLRYMLVEGPPRQRALRVSMTVGLMSLSSPSWVHSVAATSPAAIAIVVDHVIALTARGRSRL